MIRKILYASDLGLYSTYVLQHACGLARGFNATLYIVHAVQPLGLFAESVLQGYLDDSSLADLYDGGLETVMSSIKARVLEGVDDEFMDDAEDLRLMGGVNVMQGDPADVILAEAKRLNVDLIVLGGHSQGHDMAVPLGRTAARVLQLSDVPVYLVPMLHHRPGY